jgi:hypothetical protein
MKIFNIKSAIAVSGLLLSFSTFADLSGTWNLTVESPQGTSSPKMVLTQNGDKITGTYVSSMLGESSITGIEADGKFTLSAEASAQGQDFTITYIGTVDGGTIKGDIDLGGMGGAPFTGTRAK